MHIIYLADIRFPLERANGIQTMETCHALAERGHSVRLIVRPDTHQPPRDPFAFYGLLRNERLTIERAPVAGPAPARRVGYLSFAAGRALGRGRADAILTRDLGVAAMLLSLPRAMRAPLVYESHGYSPDVAAALPDMIATARPPGPAKLRRLAAREARVWRDADGYVTITEGLAREMRRRFGDRARVAVVHDGVRIDAKRSWTPPAPAQIPTVVYAGHLYAWKGVDVLLEALALLSNVRAVVVGGHESEPDLERLRTLAGRLGIAGRVTFTGLVEPAAVRGFLADATVLALPNPASALSTRYTSPLKLFEYMAAGRAIVASDLPAFREVLEDGVTAMLVAPGDARALAKGIRRVISDPVFAAALGRAAFEKAPEYGWDRRAIRLESLLGEAARGRG